MPGSFWAGVLNDEIIASIAATPYSEKLGYLSFYLVKPEFRQKGYGLPLWNKALQQLESRNIILDAMPSQIGIYQQLGFKTQYSFCSYHYDSGVMKMPSQESLILIESGEILEKVLIYDQSFFPADRRKYMRYWLSQTNAVGFAWQEGNKIVGYGLIRKAQTGFRIGPLYANSVHIASVLLQALLAQAKDDKVSISMPEDTRMTQKITSEFNLRSGTRLQRMYSKRPIDLPIEHILGITNFTFG